MKNQILIELKWFKITLAISTLFFITYKTFFGWKLKDFSNEEIQCNIAFQVLIGIALHFFLQAIILFLELVSEFIEQYKKDNPNK